MRPPPLPAPGIAEPPSADQHGHAMLSGESTGSASTPVTDTSDTTRTASGHARHVLVVEDDADIRETLVQILEEEGFRVSEAGHGAEALELLNQGLRPGLILLDLMMPVMNGWQFREELLKSEDLRDLPVVVITADGDAQRNPESLRVDGVLAKPLDLRSLLEQIERFFPESGKAPTE